MRKPISFLLIIWILHSIYNSFGASLLGGVTLKKLASIDVTILLIDLFMLVVLTIFFVQKERYNRNG